MSSRKIAKYYSKAGYNGIVCTNHFNAVIMEGYFRCGSVEKRTERFLKGYYSLKKACRKHGIDVIFGLELSFRGCEYGNGHGDCSEILVYGISPEQLREYNVTLYDMSIEQLFELANKEGWLLVEAHPFRDSTYLYNPSFLHGAEVKNGNTCHNSHDALAKAFAVKNSLIETSGSDFHFADSDGCGIILENRIITEKELVSVLKSGKYKLMGEGFRFNGKN
jgi:phosphopantetheinyl transferase (holo-ACP synthase)